MSVPLTTLPSRDRRVQVGRLESRQPRPQADLRRRRLLRLQPTDPLDRIDDADIGGLEQELARERRPPSGRALRTSVTALVSRGSSPARNVAMSSV